MKHCAFLLVLTTAVFAAPVAESDGFDIDNEALLIFSLMNAQHNGVNPTSLLGFVLTNMAENEYGFSQQQQTDLLVAGGIDNEKSLQLVAELMPLLKEKHKSTYEQILSLFLATNQLCTKNESETITCTDEERAVLPLVAMSTERGCDREYVTNPTDVYKDELCVCQDQNDAAFWLSLIDQLSRKQNNDVPDQFPVILMMLLNNSTCNGITNNSGEYCECRTVNRGQEAMLIQYLITSPQVQENLEEEQLQVIKQMVGTPETRASQSMLDYIYSGLAGFSSPQMMSLLQTQGESKDAVLKQLILSSFGFDTSALDIIFHGGFGNDTNKVSLINYFASMGAFDPTLLPLLLGVPNGKEFFISQLMQSGAVDPIMGIMLQGMASGRPQKEIMDFILLAITESSNNPNFLTSLNKPYIPQLPSGVHPGSKLFFAHFETLGVNTCALHDLRNRFNCGYIGISAAQCETVPYCCYNPVFMTDTEVSNATDGAITAATAIPWCYYNVFFVYFNTYYMEVKKPGEFASPIQCLGVFKYGLKLDPNLYHMYDPKNPDQGIGKFIRLRSECGFPGISEFQCIAIRGCCWDAKAPYKIPQCFKPNGPSQFNVNFDNIPAAYRPVPGTCDINNRRIPLLYYKRTACHYDLLHYISGYNVLAQPSEIDCLTKLGCCWERDEEVLARYPFAPQCYHREPSTPLTPSILPPVSQLVRSGESVSTDARSNGMPPVEKLP